MGNQVLFSFYLSLSFFFYLPWMTRGQNKNRWDGKNLFPFETQPLIWSCSCSSSSCPKHVITFLCTFRDLYTERLMVTLQSAHSTRNVSPFCVTRGKKGALSEGVRGFEPSPHAIAGITDATGILKARWSMIAVYVGSSRRTHW